MSSDVACWPRPLLSSHSSEGSPTRLPVSSSLRRPRPQPRCDYSDARVTRNTCCCCCCCSPPPAPSWYILLRLVPVVPDIENNGERHQMKTRFCCSEATWQWQIFSSGAHSWGNTIRQNWNLNVKIETKTFFWPTCTQRH